MKLIKLAKLLMLLAIFRQESLNVFSDTLPYQSGECMIAGYFAVHSPAVQGQTVKCGTINTHDGIVLLEAFRYAVNVTNSRGILPPGMKLGYKIFDTCKSTVQLKTHISPMLSELVLGVVGPYSSSEAILAAHVFSVFKTTEISYRASSLELEDRGRYNNFFRTVPSDRYEAAAILDIIRKHKWNYVSCINSHERQQGMFLMTKLIVDDKRCVAKQSSLPEISKSSDYDDAIDLIMTDTKAKVIVLLTTVEDTTKLIAAAKKKGFGKGIVWLGGTGWGNLVFDKDLGQIVNGAISLNFVQHTSEKDFQKYFFSRTPENNNYSYFIKFWEKVFHCSFDSTALHSELPCTSREKLRDNVRLPPFTTIGPVIDAVYIYAQVVRYALQQMCEKQDLACFKTHFYAILGWIRPSLSTKTFKSLDSANNITFDRFGGVPGQYDILNLIATENSQKYELIGQWKAGTDSKSQLVINKKVNWPNKNGTEIVSECSLPCNSKRGEVKETGAHGKASNCCWRCKLCDANDMISKNDTCLACGNDYKPDFSRKHCQKLREDSVSYTHPIGISAMVLSTVGILLTLIIAGIFIFFNKSPIVKASGRELSYFMLIGICICYSAPIIFLSPPTKSICALQRFIAGLSLNFCYAPLLLKTNRLYRIFKNATLRVSRPVLTSPVSQIIICLGITSIQILLGIVWTIGDPPEVFRHYPSSRNHVMLYCKTDTYIMELNLGVCLVLMLACTWFAFKTRNFPKNFNESKSTMLTMYASCLAWGIFLPIFTLSKNTDEYARTYTIALFCEVIAYVTLIGLFAPKIHLLFCPGGMVRDASQTGVVTRGEIRELKRNTLMSRAILSSYPAVTPKYVQTSLQFDGSYVNDISTSTTDLTELHL